MRSYLNGKVSLIEAEAISDLISARSIENIKAVNKSLAGSFEKKIDELIFELKSMRARVEGEIDFNDQDTNIDLSEIKANLDSFHIIIEDFINTTSDAVLMNEGIKTIITGPENVGKSTLMNVFTKKKTSIVSEIAGTTRDLVTKSVKIHGLVFDLIDSAGLSSRAKDKIEEIGTNLAKNALEEADLIIEVVDHNNPNYEMTYPKGKKVVKVLNKSDLAGDEKTKRINISAKYEHNITKLENCLVDAVFSSKNQVLGGFSARSRHLNLLNSCNDEILRACSLCEEFSIELCAEHLKNASGYLGQIKSPYSSDDLLGEIFSSFCIGK
jgi:tRNA modification GTPase